MGAFPSAAAQLKLPEQPDLLGQVQKVTALKSLLQGQQLQQQQIQAATMQNQMAQRKIQEGEVIRQAFVKNNGDIDKTIADASQNPVVSPETLQALQLHSIDLKTKRAAADEGALKLRATQVDNLRGLFQPVFDMPKDAPPEQIEAAYQQQRAQALKNPQAYGITDQSQIPAQFPGKQQGEALMASMVGESSQIAQETARREQALKEAQTGEAQGKEAQARAEADLKRAEIAGGGTGAMADSRYRNILQKQKLGQPVSAEDRAWKSAYENQKALIPTTNISLQAQAARGSSAALAEVPPHLVPPATAAANKAGEDYAQAQSVTQRLNAMMEAARKGNVVSYQVIPEEGTLQITTSQGVHRINQAEIQQYAGGGSLWQRMQGHFGKALSGQSIPKSVLDDMAEIQKIQSQGSQLKYNNSLKTINKTYGSKFEPVEMDTLPSVQGGSANDFFSKFGGKVRNQ